MKYEAIPGVTNTMNSTGLALGVAALAAGAMYALYSLFKAGVFSPLKVLEKQFGAMLLLHVNAQVGLGLGASSIT